MTPETPDERAKTTKTEPDYPKATPYGPHPHGVDAAAGGADSSPYDNMSSDERQARAEEDRRAGKNNDGDQTA